MVWAFFITKGTPIDSVTWSGLRDFHEQFKDTGEVLPPLLVLDVDAMSKPFSLACLTPQDPDCPKHP